MAVLVEVARVRDRIPEQAAGHRPLEFPQSISVGAGVYIDLATPVAGGGRSDDQVIDAVTVHVAGTCHGIAKLVVLRRPIEPVESPSSSRHLATQLGQIQAKKPKQGEPQNKNGISVHRLVILPLGFLRT